ERDELFHFGRTAIGALAESDGSHLRERSDWFGKAFADRLDSGDERSRDGTHARDHDSKLALGWLNGSSFGHRWLGSPGTAAASCQLHLTSGAVGMGQGCLAMFVLTSGGCSRKLLTMAAAVGVPPVGHEYTRALLIHV